MVRNDFFVVLIYTWAVRCLIAGLFSLGALLRECTLLAVDYESGACQDVTMRLSIRSQVPLDTRTAEFLHSNIKRFAER